MLNDISENIYFYLLLVNRQLDWLSRIKSRNPSVSVCHVALEFLIFKNIKRPLIHQWMKIGGGKLAAAGENREAEWVQAINVEIDVYQVIGVEQKEVGIWEVKVTGKVYLGEVQSIDGATVKLEDEEICMILNSKSKVLYAIDKINGKVYFLTVYLNKYIFARIKNQEFNYLNAFINRSNLSLILKLS